MKILRVPFCVPMSDLYSTKLPILTKFASREYVLLLKDLTNIENIMNKYEPKLLDSGVCRSFASHHVGPPRASLSNHFRGLTLEAKRRTTRK